MALNDFLAPGLNIRAAGPDRWTEYFYNGRWVDAGHFAPVDGEEMDMRLLQTLPQRVNEQKRQAAMAEDAGLLSAYQADRAGLAERFLQNQQAGNATLPSAVAQPEQSDGDPYAAFKAQFKKEWGRDITQAEQDSNEFVQQVSNGVFRLLPKDRMVGFSLDRILQLSNDDLLPLLRAQGVTKDGTAWRGWDLLAGMPTERILSMPRDYVENEVLPFLSQANPATAANIRQAFSGVTTDTPTTDTPTPGGGGGDSSGGGSGDDRFTGRSLGDIFPNQQLGSRPDLGKLTQQEMLYYFPWMGNPDAGISEAAGTQIASRNLLRSRGLSPDSGNPFAEFAVGMTGDMAEAAAARSSLSGAGDTTLRTSEEISDALGRGNVSVFGSPEEAARFLGDISGIQQRMRSGGAGLTAAQVATGQRYQDPNNAFNLYVGSQGAGLSPFLRGNEALMNRTRNYLYDQYRNQGYQGGREFLQSLIGG